MTSAQVEKLRGKWLVRVEGEVVFTGTKFECLGYCKQVNALSSPMVKRVMTQFESALARKQVYKLPSKH